MENSESILEFTETENKIRKKWLFFSTVLPAAIFGCSIIFSIVRAFISSEFTMILGILLVSLISAGHVYMNYYCAYKNPGTILLVLIMIVISLNLLITFLNPENLVLMKLSGVFFSFMLVMLIYEIVVLYYSYKLRKINKKMNERKLIASPVYMNALSVFSTAKNLEELNAQFSGLKPSHDWGSGAVALAKAYNQQKKMLNLAKK